MEHINARLVEALNADVRRRMSLQQCQSVVRISERFANRGLGHELPYGIPENTYVLPAPSGQLAQKP